jgi:hypothetical protein
MTQPRARSGKFRPYAKGERYAAQMRLLNGEDFRPSPVPEPFPIAHYLWALITVALLAGVMA